MLNSNLGNAFVRRISDDPCGNLEAAIDHFQTALSVKTDRIPPFHLAMIRLNLATACLKSVGCNRDERIEQALALCADALEICGDHYPVETAMIQYTLGNAWRQRLIGDTRENLLQAKLAYQQSLTVLTPDSMPAENLDKNIALAEVCLMIEDDKMANQALTQALIAFELLYQQNITMEGRSRIIEKGAPACFLSAYCAARAGDIPMAIERLERGKARVLADHLALDRAVFDDLRTEMKDTYRQLTEDLTGLEYALQNHGLSGDQFLELVDQLKIVRRQLNDLIAEIRMDHPEFIQDAISFNDIQTLIPDPETALVEFCVTDLGTIMIAVMHQSIPTECDRCVILPLFTQIDMNRIKDIYTTTYNVFKASNKNHADIHVFEKKTLEIVQEVYHSVFEQMDEILQRTGICRIILSPHRFLHVLPLHLMTSTVSGTEKRLFEQYEVSYAPSASVLFHVSRTLKTQSLSNASEIPYAADSLVAISNPTGDLRFADEETASVASFFHHALVLTGHQATYTRILSEAHSAGCLHFACHGTFKLDDPYQSGLYLATVTPADQSSCQSVSERSDPTVHYGINAETKTYADHRAVFFQPEAIDEPIQTGILLTLVEICHHLNLGQTRLVVLSACESGLVATGGSADEVIGLPAGFLYAGANAVLSSLWLVDDAHSRDLITDFYRCHISDGLSPAAALRQAQIQMMNRDISPYYWGGFVVTGYVAAEAESRRSNRAGCRSGRDMCCDTPRPQLTHTLPQRKTR